MGHSHCCGKDTMAEVTSRGSLTWSSSSSMSSRIPLEETSGEKKTSLRLAQSPMETHILFPFSIPILSAINIIWMNGLKIIILFFFCDNCRILLGHIFLFFLFLKFLHVFCCLVLKEVKRIKRTKI